MGRTPMDKGPLDAPGSLSSGAAEFPGRMELSGSDCLIADQVTDFLERNPAFLGRFLEGNPTLLAGIAQPEASEIPEGVIDLRSVMVARLRKEVQRLGEKLEDIVRISRANMTAQALMHEAVLSMLQARDLEELLDVVTTDLARLLSIDVVTICIESEEDPIPDVSIPGVYLIEPGSVDALLGRGEPIRLDGMIRGHPLIFGHAAGLVRSQALLRVAVGPERSTGVLALGTREESQFDEGQGTDLLDFLARSFEGVLSHHMLPPTTATAAE